MASAHSREARTAVAVMELRVLNQLIAIVSWFFIEPVYTEPRHVASMRKCGVAWVPANYLSGRLIRAKGGISSRALSGHSKSAPLARLTMRKPASSAARNPGAMSQIMHGALRT